ncbi:MAG: hypothetical protein GY758_19430 [Fuerstiella sp.]|nr:hypothetical protein [Fuerstiella sp.]MCP4505994.1 hypothetical protein [Fuerstiella sp.]
MAKCDQGYLCEICGEEVASIRESDLYLRYVTGQMNSRELLASPERHLRCNAVVGQFIVHRDFDMVTVDGPFSKTEMDAIFVTEQESLITRGWRRLQELAELADTLPLSDYPLPEFRTQGHGSD